MRSMLAGVAKTGSETAQRLEGFASVRSTLAGLAERGLNAPPLCKGRGTTKWWKGCKKSNPSPPAAELPLHKGAFFKSIAALPHRFSSIFSLLSYLKKPACQAGFLFHFSAFLTVHTSSPSFASTMSVSPISRSFERIVRATSVSTLPCKYLLSGLAP